MKGKIITLSMIWSFILIISLLTVSAGISCGDLSLNTTDSNPNLGDEFKIHLWYTGTMGIFQLSDYANATLGLPTGLTSLDPLNDGTLSGTNEEWNVNATQVGDYLVNATVYYNNGTTVNCTGLSVNVSGATQPPYFIITVPDVQDHLLIGQQYSINVTFNNTGNGTGTVIGTISHPKVNFIENTFSITAANSSVNTSTFTFTPASSGNDTLTIGVSDIKNSESTSLLLLEGYYSANNDSFSVNFNPILDLSSINQINVVQSNYNDSIDLYDYVTDSDTVKSSLNWAFSSDNVNVNASMDAVNHLLNVTAGDFIGSAVLTVYVNDSYYQDSDTVNIVVSPNCTESWSYTGWSDCSSSGTQTRTCTDSNSCGTELNKPAESQSCTYTPPSTGGGGSASATTASRSFSWSSLSAGSITVMKISDSRISVSEVEVKILNELKNAEIKVEEIKTLPQSISPPKGAVYQYLNFIKNNMEDSDIEKAVIDFSVSKKWLSDNNIDKAEVVLMRYKNDEWNELTTEIIHSNTIDVHFNAISPGFSYFAIGKRSEISEDIEELAEDTAEAKDIEEEAEEEIKELAEEETQQTTNEITGAVTQETGEEGEESAPWVMPDWIKSDWLKYMIYALAGIVILGLIIGLDIARRKKKAKKSKKEKGFFRKGWDKTVNFFMADDEEIAPLKKGKKKE